MVAPMSLALGARATAVGGLYIDVHTQLESDQGSDEVRREEDLGRRLGIDAVPHFLIDGTLPLSGAIEPGTIVSALQRAPEQRRA